MGSKRRNRNSSPSASASITRYGTEGDDGLYGASGNDYLWGYGGDDGLYGRAGNDQLAGGDGEDGLYGEDGDDSLFGEAGTDGLFGGFGNDTLVGGSGDDGLWGGPGSDVLYGSDGIDSLDGEEGADIYWGGSGADVFYSDKLTNSNLAGYDQIKDFEIGLDVLWLPDNVEHLLSYNILGSVSSLAESSLVSLLNPTRFSVNSAAIFQVQEGASLRTFIASNDSVPGFSSMSDGLVEITGYRGALSDIWYSTSLTTQY
jgi:hypothetical protein